jgi:hypothetical protein
VCNEVKKETTKEKPLRRIQKTKACDIRFKKLHTVQWVSKKKDLWMLEIN